jgi:hypothetical protein
MIYPASEKIRSAPPLQPESSQIRCPAMTKLLKRLDCVYKKPKCVPAKADAAVQEQFAKEVLLPLMVQASAGKPLYCVDGMHPAYTAHPAFGWIRCGPRVS